MATVRVWPDYIVHAAILEAAEAFEARLTAATLRLKAVMASGARLVPTERKIIQEMFTS